MIVCIVLAKSDFQFSRFRANVYVWCAPGFYSGGAIPLETYEFEYVCFYERENRPHSP